jgi:hypothetical protein
MEIAGGCIGVFLRGGAVHLEGFDLRVIIIVVDPVVDDCESAIIFVVLKHQPRSAIVILVLLEIWRNQIFIPYPHHLSNVVFLVLDVGIDLWTETPVLLSRYPS